MDEDDIGSDIRTTLAEYRPQENNNVNLPALRTEGDQNLPATREQVEERQPRSQSLSTNREQEIEDERAHPDEEDPTDRLTPARTPAAQVPAALQPPVSWKGALKESWTALPAPVQAEINRREREVAQTLSRTAEERRYANAIYAEIQPFEHHIRAENSDHPTAVRHLFQMAHLMRAGTVAQKADLIAELFFRHDVPIIEVDNALKRRLAGGQGQPADPVRAAIQAELAPIREFMKQAETSRTQVTNTVKTNAAAELAELGQDPTFSEYLADPEIRDAMADILESAAKRNVQIPLRSAASRAIMAHPEYGAAFSKAQLEAKAQGQREIVAKKQRAAASLPNDGAPSATDGNEDEGDDVRSALVASMRQLNSSSRT